MCREQPIHHCPFTLHKIHPMPKKILAAFFLLLLYTGSKAQNFPSDSALTRMFQSDVLLPLLIDSAIKNSPEIKRNRKNVQLLEQNLQTSRKAILNSILLTSGYGYGNTGSLSLEKDLINVNQGNFYSNIRSSRYNIGVSLMLPLSSLLTRKNTTRASELQLEMAGEEREGAELLVKGEVIKMYQEVKLAHSALLITAKMKQSASIAANMGQKNFLDGQVAVEQFSKLQNDYGQAQMDYEGRLNKFQTAFLLLESYTGVQLTKLINRIK